MTTDVRFTVKVNGARQTAEAFDSLNGAVRRRILRRANVASARPSLRAAKASGAYEDRTRSLRKSLAIRTKTRKQGDAVSSLIAPKSEATGNHKGRVVQPSRYAHLVEKGHRIAVSVASGQAARGFALRSNRRMKMTAAIGGRVQGRAFLGPALRSTSPEAVRKFGDVFGPSVESEARKAAKQ